MEQSPPMAEILRARGLVATMPDGVELVADAWYPDEPGGRWPVLLQRLPYGRAVASAPVLPHPSELARHGYAVVVQDVRGRGDSGGTFEPFVDDGVDGAASIEWAARLPFSDGQVATYGFSYQGLNQLYAAARRPASLKAIAPMMCSTEPYEGWTYQAGSLRWPFVAGWSAQLASQEPGADLPPVDLTALPLRQALGPEAPRWFVEWLDHAEDDAYWAARRPDLSAIEVPAFTVLGYFDDFALGTARLIDALGAEAVCGPWAHMPWGTRTATTELGPAAAPTVAHGALLAFFDRVLKGGEVAPARITYFDPVAGWRGAAAWPPVATSRTWHAASPTPASSRHGGGLLVGLAPGAPLHDVLVSEPLVPYPGQLEALSDEGAAEDRRDVLCYTTAPLPEAVTLAGGGAVRAVVRADSPSFDLVASLVAVAADGTPRRLATGVRRVGTQALEEDLEVRVDLSPLAWTVPAGGQLRLDLSGSRFPAFDRNPHSKVPAADATRADCVVATIEVRAVELTLPGA
jgi:hypothetical protein